MILPQQLSKLKPLQQWVNYVRIWNQNKHAGAGGYDKPPINPHTLRDAKTTDPATWTTFDQAAANIGKTATHWDPKRHENVTAEIEGVGLVLANGFCGVDFDDVLDEAGNVPPFIAGILDRLNTYTEISPSGRGLHSVLYCPDLMEAGQDFGGQFPINREGCITQQDQKQAEIEVYFYQNGGRYLTFSGSVYRDKGINKNKGAYLRKLYDACRDAQQRLRAAKYEKQLQSVGSQSSQYTTRGTATEKDDRKMIDSALAAIDPGALDFNEWAAIMTALKVTGHSLQDALDWSAGDLYGVRNSKDVPATNKRRWSKFSFKRGDDRAGGVIIRTAQRFGWKTSDAFDDDARREYGRSLYTEEQRREYGRRQHQKRMDDFFKEHAADFEKWKQRKASDVNIKEPFLIRGKHSDYEKWKQRHKQPPAAADPGRTDADPGKKEVVMLKNKKADFEAWKAERGLK